MNLHELSPAPGSKEPPFALAVVSVPDLVKHLAKVKRTKSRSGGVKRPGFEGGQNLCICVCLNVDSIIDLA